MTENREHIVDLLFHTLRATREFRHLDWLSLEMELDENEEETGREIVHAVFEGGKVIDINVTGDSGSAIIEDVWNALYR